MIGTHNSGTGMKGHGVVSWLVTPFARCQGKTLVEQYLAGCRYYDIRVRQTARGWVLAHGLWESEDTAMHALMQLHDIIEDDDLVYGHLCYEGVAPDGFVQEMEKWQTKIPKIRISYLAQKKPRWDVLRCYEAVVTSCGYEKLVWPNWRMLVPIPWLWKKLHGKKVCEDDGSYELRDFL